MSESQRDLQLAYDLLWKVRRREGLTSDRLPSFEEQQKKGISLKGIMAVVAFARSLGVEINEQFDNTDELGSSWKTRAGES